MTKYKINVDEVRFQTTEEMSSLTCSSSDRTVSPAMKRSPQSFCCANIQVNPPKSEGKPRFRGNASHPCSLKRLARLTGAIGSMDTCHESFMVMGREWIISGTQVLSGRGSAVTRSIYTISLRIRPRERRADAQSTLLLLHRLTSSPGFPISWCRVECHSRRRVSDSGWIASQKRHM